MSETNNNKSDHTSFWNSPLFVGIIVAIIGGVFTIIATNNGGGDSNPLNSDNSAIIEDQSNQGGASEETNSNAEDLPVVDVEAEIEELTDRYPRLTNWNRIESLDVSIWLPTDYESVSLEGGAQFAVAGIRTSFPELAAYANLIEQSPDLFRLMAISQEYASQGLFENVMITRETPLITMTFDEYVEFSLNSFPEGFDVVEQNEVRLDNYDAVSFIVENTTTGIPIVNIMYTIQNAEYFYNVAFTTLESEFDDERSNFELAMETFRIID